MAHVDCLNRGLVEEGRDRVKELFEKRLLVCRYDSVEKVKKTVVDQKELNENREKKNLMKDRKLENDTVSKMLT